MFLSSVFFKGSPFFPYLSFSPIADGNRGEDKKGTLVVRFLSINQKKKHMNKSDYKARSPSPPSPYGGSGG